MIRTKQTFPPPSSVTRLALPANAANRARPSCPAHAELFVKITSMPARAAAAKTSSRNRCRTSTNGSLPKSSTGLIAFTVR